MSKMDTRIGQDGPRAALSANIDRLQAVDSVMQFISDIAGLNEANSLGMPDRAQLEQPYLNSQPMVQRRVDAICDDLAAMAQTGGKAVLQMKSNGGQNLEFAAARLLREIEVTSRPILRIFRI